MNITKINYILLIIIIISLKIYLKNNGYYKLSNKMYIM